jgi:acetyl-CoA carboxylase biotin carboxyl carrier protein
MSLTAADVAEIMRLLEQSSFDELNLEFDGIKLSLRRGAAAVEQPAPVVAAPLSAPPAPVTSSAPKAQPQEIDPTLHAVAAPMLGTFYRAPKPGAPPFVEVGSEVEADTVVGIIEVMKLMNTVRAGVRGTVTEIVGSDGALVEYGETLLRLRKVD